MYPYMFYRQQSDQEQIKYQRNQGDITVEGKGVVEVAPDMAIVTLGVVTTGENVALVQQDNDEQMNKIVEGLTKAGVQESEIQTVQYRIYPKYDYVEGKQVPKGYEINNVIQIKVMDLTSLNDIVVEAVQNGANISQGITFTVEDLSSVYEDALKKAVSNGQDKALEIANAMGVSVNYVPISTIEKSMDQYGPVPMASLKEASGSVQIGTIKVPASVIQKYIITS